MNIEQTAAHLRRMGQPFDVIITKGGLEKELYANCEPTDVEGLLKEVLENHKPDSLIIQERKRNGATNVKKDKFSINLGGIDNTPSIPTQMQPTHPTSGLPSEYKDYLITEQNDKIKRLKTKLEKLEEQNEKLKEENNDLKANDKFKDKEFEISKREMELERSNGLSGIMETVATNPALATIAATAIGRLMGIDVPAMGGIEGGGQEPGNHSDNGTTQGKVAGYIRNWLDKQSEETTTMFFQLTSSIANNIEILPDLVAIAKQEQ